MLEDPQNMVASAVTPPKPDDFPRQTPELISCGLDSRRRLGGTRPHSPYVVWTSFSKIDTSVRSMPGTQTLLSMRQFIEDAEKENEKEKGSLDAELEAMDSSTLAQKTAAQ